jgi:hypothetical protein
MLHKHTFHLSKKDGEKIMCGGAITYNHNKRKQMPSKKPVDIHLTKLQKKKLLKSLQSGKGFKLKFTKKQMQHHLLHGGAFWDKFKNFFTKTMPKVFNNVKNVVTDPEFKKGVKTGFKYGFRYPAMAVETLLPQTKPAIDVVRSVADKVGIGMKRQSKKVKAGSLLRF